MSTRWQCRYQIRPLSDENIHRTGEELEAFLQRHGGASAFDRIMYVGDGGNDYCPVLRLRAGSDVAFVRRFRGLEKRIKEEGNVKCGVRWWAGAWEMETLMDESRGKIAQ